MGHQEVTGEATAQKMPLLLPTASSCPFYLEAKQGAPNNHKTPQITTNIIDGPTQPQEQELIPQMLESEEMPAPDHSRDQILVDLLGSGHFRIYY